MSFIGWKIPYSDELTERHSGRRNGLPAATASRTSVCAGMDMTSQSSQPASARDGCNTIPASVIRRSIRSRRLADSAWHPNNSLNRCARTRRAFRHAAAQAYSPSRPGRTGTVIVSVSPITS